MSKWLVCEVKPGMFSDEFTVIVKTRSGEAVAVFVPRDAANEPAGRVRVDVISNVSGRAVATLPDEQPSVVEVESANLVAA